MEIVLDKLHKLIRDSENVCGCLTLDEMYIELASLIICSINENLTNTSSATPLKQKKETTLYIVNLILLYTSTDTSVY